jgi:hypothetical protein
MTTYLKIFRLVFLFVGTITIMKALVTGRIPIKGGKWIVTKSMPNNPILRLETPRDYWFAFCFILFVFVVLSCVFFTVF